LIELIELLNVIMKIQIAKRKNEMAGSALVIKQSSRTLFAWQDH